MIRTLMVLFARRQAPDPPDRPTRRSSWKPLLRSAALLLAGTGAADAACAPGGAGTSGMITTIAGQLMDNCWSCSLYSTLYFGMRSLVNTTYATLVSGNLGGPALGITIVAIAAMFRFLPFLVGSEHSENMVAGLRLFAFRISIVFIVFLGSASASVMAPNGILSDFFVDGPLALGTAVAESLSTVTSTALAQSTSQPNISLFGTYGSVPGGGNADMDGGNSGFAAEHVRAATTILYNLHQMGVVGIVMGLWLGLEDPNVTVTQPGVMTVVMSAALFMTYTFFMFTLTFGLKYIDALIRAMLIFSLTPLFVFLWIFDSTRAMAVQALKSGLALAGMFAVSGVVFTTAYYILELGYYNAFANQGVSFTGLQATLCSLNATSVANLIGATGQGASLNWMAYFYLVGSATLATACASLTFDLAAQIFDFGSAEMGVGSAVQNDLNSGAQSVFRASRGMF